MGLDALLAESGDAVNAVIEFNVPDSILEERICGRWIHKAFGRSYHVKFNPPKSLGDNPPSAETMKDDQTGESLMQRSDDTAEALVKRLKGYHEETEPILQRYQAVVHRINANQSMASVKEEVEAVISPLMGDAGLLQKLMAYGSLSKDAAYLRRSEDIKGGLKDGACERRSLVDESKLRAARAQAQS